MDLRCFDPAATKYICKSVCYLSILTINVVSGKIATVKDNIPDDRCTLDKQQVICGSAACDEVAEWLRRWTANPLGSARVGSNPILVVGPMV